MKRSRIQNISVLMLQNWRMRPGSLPNIADTSSLRQSSDSGEVVLYKAAYVDVSML